ncbi:pentatricopeptide repeat-containing protein At1g11290, chloroplastic [Cryptomeria japonica]|uniref:pentatricopeptide repeat-containing protein At1g11290, chloroplastic n=1 Tax=Cryptomeria japonica TaxID=3369 RepID=UPI0027DA498F|nr:pentatricopeptide repeat-containing protein At1g11290, chloroplastic [Cryptomeria japonica]
MNEICFAWRPDPSHYLLIWIRPWTGLLRLNYSNCVRVMFFSRASALLSNSLICVRAEIIHTGFFVNWVFKLTNKNPKCGSLASNMGCFNTLAALDFEFYASQLIRCTNVKTLKQIHTRMLICGLDQNMFLGTKLVRLYAMLGSLNNARQVFDRMYKQDAFLWNVMIRGYATFGQCEETLMLYNQMQQVGLQPDCFTFPFVLKACGGLSAIHEGKRIHEQIVEIGLESNVYVGAALVDMHAKCGSMEDARLVFEKMYTRDAVLWSVMIVGYVQSENAPEALSLFNQMLLTDLKPNAITIASVISASAAMGDLQQGELIHEYAVKNGFGSDVSVVNSFVAMYAKCGKLQVARDLFDKMSERDVVSWNGMIAGYQHSGDASKALALFHQMQLEDVKPDLLTMVSVLAACADLGDMQRGRWMHSSIIKSGLELYVSIGNSLIVMYAKSGSVCTARLVFDLMPKRELVSWNAMIAGYSQNGLANEALDLFHEMQVADVKPNSSTFGVLLSACAHSAALEQGKQIHDCIIASKLDSDLFVTTSLIDMYAKCGSLEVARLLFDKMNTRDVVSWNAMIAGHAGLVDEGWQYFACMSQIYCIAPMARHYACMVDLLGRAGQLDKAYDFIQKMPLEPDAGVWGALLGACRIHCNIKIGEKVAERIFYIDPGNAGYYVLLSNIYVGAGRFADAAKLRAMMKDKGVKKNPGCSLIEIDNRVHTFLVGDKSHPRSQEIYAALQVLVAKMEEAGYVPNTNFALHDIEDETKEHLLYSHSERLAIVFGLISTSPGTPIRITKNLRVCGDCHTAIKFISNIVKREIVVRDANRFHHVKGGLCSCGDYW